MSRPRLELKVPVALASGAKLPSYQTPGAAGADLSLRSQSPVLILPQTVILLSTGVRLAIPEGWEGQIRLRSSLALKGLIIPNAPGTIDSDYRGELKIALGNLGRSAVTLMPGERVAQLVLAPVDRAHFSLVEEGNLPPSQRGAGGFGSTGR